MKVVILAGGLGTRISEESERRPKPMLEIGNMPILWHIMKGYSHYGFYEFVICAGYKQHIIKEWFADYFLYTSDVTFDFTQDNRMTVHNRYAEPWKVTIVDTGLNTMTGGRIKRIQKFVGNEPFMLTYGDGVCDINLNELEAYHKSRNTFATLTAIQPGGRFGVLGLSDNNAITSFVEKNKADGGWINGGFMVLEPQVFDYIAGDETIFERDPLECLARDGQLSAYTYEGFWQCMDTLRDKLALEELIATKKAPWVRW